VQQTWCVEARVWLHQATRPHHNPPRSLHLVKRGVLAVVAAGAVSVWRWEGHASPQRVRGQHAGLMRSAASPKRHSLELARLDSLFHQDPVHRVLRARV
jgi:hypothetical protein